MAYNRWHSREEQTLRELYAAGESTREIARRLRRTRASVINKARELALVHGGARCHLRDAPQPGDLGDLLAEQRRRYEEKRASADARKNGYEIEIADGPFALVFVGDPHLDDDGCDWARIHEDLETVNSHERVFGVCMGDLTNNWAGRLARLYGRQAMTENDAERVMEWFLGEADWLFVILGNHDRWGPLAQRICREYGILAVDAGARFEVLAGGFRLLVDARHDHPGRSVYNPAHGQLRRGFRGSPCHIIVGGHTHQSGYTVVKNPETGRINHCVRVGTYKTCDDYADELGLGDAMISPSVMAVVDPTADREEGLVSIFHDLRAGRRYLQCLLDDRS